MLQLLLLFAFMISFGGEASAQQSPCYWSGQLVKCFPTTGIYLDSSRTLRLGTNNTTNYVELKAPSGMSGNVSLTFPSSNSSGALTNDGSGGLTWMTGGGGVTSVGLALPSIFTVSGSPVTGSGTLTGTLATEVANTIFSGPTTGADAAPTFRALVTADLPTVPITKGGTGQTTANAGFNALSPMTTAGDIIYGGTAGAGTRLAIGGATTVLHGGTTAPAYAAVTLTTDVTGTLPAANGGTGQVSTAIFPTSGSVATDVNGLTFSNKTLDNSNTFTPKDTLFTLQDDSDSTRRAQFQLSAIAASTTRSFTLPDVSGVVGVIDAAQTLSNKTLDNTNAITVKDGSFTLQNTSSVTKQAVFSLASITAGQTRTITLPDANITLVANPLTTTGDIIYGVGSVPTRLAGNVTNSTFKVLTSTATAGVANAPTFSQISDPTFFTSGAEVTQAAAGVVKTAGQLLGTNTNDDAASGYTGEYLTASSTGTTVSASATFTNIATITLTAGDWDVTGVGAMQVGTAVGVTSVAMAVSAFSGNTTTDHVTGDNAFSGFPPVAAYDASFYVANWRVKVTGSTAIYLKGRGTNITSGALTGVGRLSARRER